MDGVRRRRTGAVAIGVAAVLTVLVGSCLGAGAAASSTSGAAVSPLTAGMGQAPHDPVTRTTFVLPVASAVVVRPFEAPARRYAAGHRGVDLATRPGRVVMAPASGIVAFAGSVAGRPVLAIDHGGGRRSALEPVIASVAVGDQVAAGDDVGITGAGGHCAESCVHWGVRVDGVYIDPMALLRQRVVLLPLGRHQARGPW